MELLSAYVCRARMRWETVLLPARAGEQHVTCHRFREAREEGTLEGRPNSFQDGGLVRARRCG
ncbi:MAG TPA: hypothetical protein VKS03_11465, partial [Thermoanaerobaculia bacterium]|nr:hypothetical protein [Thermoanaerobaculia bacterium]